MRQQVVLKSGTETSTQRIDRRRAPIFLAAVALVTLACTCSNLLNPSQLIGNALPPEAEQAVGEIQGTFQAMSTPPTPGPSGGQALPDLLSGDQLDLVGIQGTTDDATFGRILTLQVTNPGTTQVIAEVPCGLVFNPETDGEQRMMVIQPASAEVGPGDSQELVPYVACIDPEQRTPTMDSTFTVGTMATGDLLKLASCICEEPLEGQLSLEAGADLLGVQLAVWSVAMGDSPSALMERDLGGAAGEALGESGAEFLGNMMDMLLAPANAWLERCGVEPEK